MPTRPILFVGSSSEGLKYAKALQVNLDHVCQVVIWSQGIFGLSGGTLEDLVEKIKVVDFGALVVTPDDVSISRGTKSASPRDNVLLELGICIGSLGRERSFLVHDRSKPIKLPSDLAGITHASFLPHDDGNATASVGAASTEIENKILELGERPKHGVAGLIDQDTQFRVIADLLGIIACNYIIQMHDLDAKLLRERNVFGNMGKYWYGIEFPGRYLGNGRFSINDLCEKMPDAGILTQDLKFKVFLTERGPPRQNTCRPDRTKNLGVAKKEWNGTIRTGVQGPSGGAIAAAGECGAGGGVAGSGCWMRDAAALG